LRKELDFEHEHRNMETARKYLGKNVYIPQVFYSDRNVLIMEWIDGFKIDELANNPAFNTKAIITSIIDIFSSQIFESGFVHCDPHPGNLLVRKCEGQDQIVLIDFGLCIQMSPQFRTQ